MGLPHTLVEAEQLLLMVVIRMLVVEVLGTLKTMAVVLMVLPMLLMIVMDTSVVVVMGMQTV